MATTNNKKEEARLEVKISGFLATYKRLIIIIAVLVVVVIAGVWIGLSVSHQQAEKAQLGIDSLQKSYDSWLSVEDKDSDEAETKTLIEDLTRTASGNGKSYPELKAAYLLGLVYEETGEDALALEQFMIVSEKGSKTYLGSLALFNAAATTENLGDAAKALALYQQVYDVYGANAAEAPKALFNIARLHESNKNIELAKAVFQQLADEFPSSEYAKLAKNRLVVL